jgi:heterodisulfide reductase subunit A-like polyferredoxin
MIQGIREPRFDCIQNYNSKTNSKFHEKLPEDDPAGSIQVANVQNITNDNTVTLVTYYDIYYVDGCIIIFYIIHNKKQTINKTTRTSVGMHEI